MTRQVTTLPFPEIDYTSFHSLAKKLEDVAQTESIINDTKEVFLYHPDSIRVIAEEAGRLGFRRVSDDVRRGSSALAFEANDHQMLRIVAVKAEGQQRPLDWDILQPMMSMRCGRGDSEFIIELLPKVHTLHEITTDRKLSAEYHLTENDVPNIVRQLLICSLQKKPSQVFFDPSPRNIAIIRDKEGNNVPVIIDPGAIINRDIIDLHSWHGGTFSDVLIRRCVRERILPEFMSFTPIGESYGRSIYTYLRFLSEQEPPRYDFRKAQEDHLELLGLSAGKASRVVSGAAAGKFYAKHADMAKNGKGLSKASLACADMSTRDGLYDKEIMHILKQATASVAPDSDENSFCQAIEKQREKYLRTIW